MNHPEQSEPTHADSGARHPQPSATRASASQQTGRPSNLQRAAGALRVALPLIQKVLPMIDSGIVSVVTNILAPALHTAPQQQANTTSMQNGFADLRARHQALRTQVAEQTATLKKVEDRLDLVREATDRNTLEQQELVEDLHSISRKVNHFAWLVAVLLLVSVGINIYLVLMIHHVAR